MSERTHQITRLDWLGLSLAMIALQLEWAAEYAFLTPVLLRLGLSPGFASLAWLPSPLVQIVLSPWLGRLSDEWGSCDNVTDSRPSWASWAPPWTVATRRHPFLLASATCATAMLLLIGLSDFLPDTSTQISDESQTATVQWGRALLAIGAFVVLDASNSINEVFQRSLFTDLAGDDAAARTLGHSILAGAVGFGGAMGYLLAAVNLASVVHSSSTMTVLFLGSTAVFVPAQLLLLTKSAVIVRTQAAWSLVAEENVSLGGNDSSELRSEENDARTSCMALYESLSIEVPSFRQETSNSRTMDVASNQGAEGISGHLSAHQKGLTPSLSWIDVLRQSSSAFRLLCVQQLFAWLGLWPVWLFATAYFGGSVYGAVPDSTDGTYDAGVRAGSLACASMGIVNMIASGLVLPFATRIYGNRVVYASMQAIGSLSVLSLYLVRDRALSTMLLAMSGFSWAANNSISFSVVRQVCKKGDIAVHTNVLYLVHTMPQLIGALVFGPIIELTGSDYAVAMAMSGTCGLVAVLLGVVLMPTN